MRHSPSWLIYAWVALYAALAVIVIVGFNRAEALSMQDPVATCEVSEKGCAV